MMGTKPLLSMVNSAINSAKSGGIDGGIGATTPIARTYEPIIPPHNSAMFGGIVGMGRITLDLNLIFVTPGAQNPVGGLCRRLLLVLGRFHIRIKSGIRDVEDPPYFCYPSAYVCMQCV